MDEDDSLDIDLDDLTPPPRLGPLLTPQQADYRLLEAAYAQLTREHMAANGKVAALQALCDEQSQTIRRLLGERYVLATAIRKLKEHKCSK